MCPYNFYKNPSTWWPFVGRTSPCNARPNPLQVPVFSPDISKNVIAKLQNIVLVKSKIEASSKWRIRHDLQITLREKWTNMFVLQTTSQFHGYTKGCPCHLKTLDGWSMERICWSSELPEAEKPPPEETPANTAVWPPMSTGRSCPEQRKLKLPVRTN